MNEECRVRLLKLIPMLGSNQDGEVLAAVAAIDRVLKLHKLDFHALASSVQVKSAINTQVYTRTKPRSPKKDDNAFYYNNENLDESTYDTLLTVCDDFRILMSIDKFILSFEETNFINRLYFDLKNVGRATFLTSNDWNIFHNMRQKHGV